MFPTASHSLFVPLSSELCATCIIIRILLQCMPYPLKCSIYIALIYRLQIISLSPTRLTFRPWKTLMQVFFQENSVNTGIEAQLSLCYRPRLLLQKWVSYSSSVSPNFREHIHALNTLMEALLSKLEECSMCIHMHTNTSLCRVSPLMTTEFSKESLYRSSLPLLYLPFYIYEVSEKKLPTEVVWKSWNWFQEFFMKNLHMKVYL